MANSAQSRKRVKQSDKRRASNMSQRSAMRTAIKQFIKSIENKAFDAAQALQKQVFAKIDTIASKKLIHANKASRLKSRLNARLKKATSA